MKARDRPKGFLTSSLLILSGAHMVTHVFGRIHTALFPVFREEFRLSLQQLGLIASVPMLCQALCYVPGGLLSDRFGQKTLLTLSFLLAGTAAIAMSFSSNVLTLIVLLSVLIASITIYHPSAYSLTSETFPGETRGRALGVHGAGGTLGMALGPISLSLFMGYFFWDWRSIYLFWAFPILLYTLTILQLKTPTNQDVNHEPAVEKADKFHVGIRSVLTTGLLGFLIFQATRHMGSQMIETFIPTYIHYEIGLTVAEASFIYGVATLTGVVAAPVGGYLADKLGDKRWLTIALGCHSIFLALSASTYNINIFSLFYWLSGFFSFSGMGAASSIIARSIPSGHRGLGYALYFIPVSVAKIFSSIIGASIAEAFSLWSILPVSAAILALSLVVLKFTVPTTG